MTIEGDFRTQIAIWGWAVTGETGLVARVAEEDPMIAGYPGWDEPEELGRVLLNGVRPPDYFACYWIGEHVRRGHEVLSH